VALQEKIQLAGTGGVDDAMLTALHRMVTVGSSGLHLHYLHIMDFHLAWDVLCWLGPRSPPFKERARARGPNLEALYIEAWRRRRAERLDPYAYGLTRRVCTAVTGAGDRAALLRARAAMHQCVPAAVPRRHGARHVPGGELGAGTGAGACGP